MEKITQREIKFRAWDGKKMHYLEDETFWLIGNSGYFELQDHRAEHFDTIESVNGYKDLSILNYNDRAILMQFTGLQDKEGKDIYEGDIVKFHYFYGRLGAGLGFEEAEYELTGTVEWGLYGWGISAIKGEHWQGYTGYSEGEGESSFMDLMAMNESSIHEESFEIIGDIYTTPHLLNPAQ